MKKVSNEEIEQRKLIWFVNKKGEKARLYKWRTGGNHIDIIFENGQIKSTSWGNLKRGVFSSKEKLEDISGMRYGKLTVLHKTQNKDKRGGYLWKCQCDCGETVYETMGTLNNGYKKSCGCRRFMDISDVAINRIINQYKKGAQSRNIEWKLSHEDVKNIINKPCFYCGMRNTNKKKIRYERTESVDFEYMGIDRIDNEKGYVSNNIRPCCKVCNTAKNNMKLEDFYQWIQCLSNNCRNIGIIQ